MLNERHERASPDLGTASAMFREPVRNPIVRRTHHPELAPREPFMHFSAPLSSLFLCATLSVLCAVRDLRAQSDMFDNPAEREKVVSLKGSWRFSVGDDLNWAKPEYDDGHWTRVDLPNEWEDEGYRDYNGYAWYRKKFDMPRGRDGRRFHLSLGRIDDVDQVFVNGVLIGGTGQFPPNYRTAYNADRIYGVPANHLRPGEENVIAVRVYDGGGRGGIYEGRLSVFTTNYPKLAIALDGPWKFRTGDDTAWAAPDCDESEFTAITVPGFWEHAGFPDHDGHGWYRTTFTVLENPADTMMVLLLGQIDDLDEVYLNGKLIGGTGDMANPHDNHGVDHYRQNRGYTFPTSLLQGTNTLAVRVYDNQGLGGIYTGPVGVMAQSDYIEFWERRRRDSNSLWRWLKSID